MDSAKNAFNDLLGTIRRLRGDRGCPWDRQQTDQTLIKYLLEEVDELLDAINREDHPNICEETGDVIYILLMMTEIHEQQHNFTLHDVLVRINQKLIRRHPHVFAGTQIENEEQLRRQWQRIKEQEKNK